MEKSDESRAKFSRRDFLRGSAAAGALALGGAALAGCSSPKDSGASGTSASAADGDLGEAAPIPPVDAPASWDGEADIVVVGTGGGGLAATLLARDEGASVITLEKETTPGGSTKHANHYVAAPGGSKMQDEVGYAYPEFPYNRKKFVQTLLPNYQFSVNDELLGNIADYGGITADWMTDHNAPWICTGSSFMPIAAASGEQTAFLGFKQITDHFYNLAEEAGAEFRLGTTCEGLVVEDGRVVGVKAKDAASGEEQYFKGTKGVILCSGGFGMNWDMLKEYIPTAYKYAVYGGPMPSHTGECTRMAIGAGADISGWDSWCCWESAPDNGTKEFQFFWGIRNLLQVPWLNIDLRGQRYNFYNTFTQPDLPDITGIGEHVVGATKMSRQGGRGYAIFDSDFEQYMYKLEMPPFAERQPTTANDPIVENDLFDADWNVQFEKALETGLIKKGDTIEELATELELDPEVVAQAVENWNDLCDKGEDTELVFPYLPEWLTPVKNGPFYGAKIGGCIGKTLTGLRVDPELRVLNEEGKAIPGLYANFTTAGGICGESSYGGSLQNSSILGGNGLSWASGYLAAETALKS